MLAYLSTKSQFLNDAPEIADRVRTAVRDELGLTISRESSEFRSWQNSLGNAMFHVLNSDAISDDVGVAIEYRVRGGRRRIDMMLSGYDLLGMRKIALVELKQWSKVESSPLAEHVIAEVARGHREQTLHPSFQSWSYASLLRGFYEVVTSEPIGIAPCAYVHNCEDDSVLRSPDLTSLLERSPVFIDHEMQKIRQFLATEVPTGDAGEGLRVLEASPIAPSKQLVTALQSMLDGTEEFVLVDDQKTAYESIMSYVTTTTRDQHRTLVVLGGPGTGKSVIAVNALVSLLSKGLNVRYVTKNAAPREVYRQKLERNPGSQDLTNLFMSSDSFHGVERNAYDVLLIDESHRLVQKSGFYRNLGDNQVAEAIAAARVSVFFLDPNQQVTWRDIGSIDEIASYATLLGSPLEIQELESQFRCAGSDDYLAWVDAVLQISDAPAPVLAGDGYDVRMAASPSDLRDLIFEKNLSNNTSRLLAGYCWDWKSKKDPTAMDIVFPGTDFAMQWNLTKDGSAWIISPESVREVGCIHTCQGLEGDYMGVIVGDDLIVRDGVVITRPKARAKTDGSLKGWKTALKANKAATLEKCDRLIRNTYRTLLSRGMKGTFIYSTDPETQIYFQRCLGELSSD